MGREKEVQNGAAKRRGWDRTLGKMNIAQTTMNAHFKLRGRRALCTVSALSELVPDKSGGRVRPEIQREGHKCGQQQRNMRGGADAREGAELVISEVRRLQSARCATQSEDEEQAPHASH